MEIRTVKIKNFRGFKSLEVDFGKSHALVGENGSGKTGVLEAINMAVSSGKPHLDEQDFNILDEEAELSVEVIFDKPFINRLPDGYTTQDIICDRVLMTAHRRIKAAPGKALSDQFVIDKYTVPVEYAAGDIPDVATGGTTVHIPSFVEKTESGYKSPRGTGSEFNFTQKSLSLQNDTINFPNIFYFDRNREIQSKVGYNSLLQRIADDLNWRYRQSWVSGEIQVKWDDFYSAVISTVEDPKKDRIIQPLRDRLKNVAGLDFPDLELSLLDIEQPFSKTFFARRNGTNQIEQKRLGSGIAIILSYFLLDIISRLSKEVVIFLIDEPELHLHPQLQNALFGELRKSEFQTIYTTQSDCMIDISEWECISRFQLDFQVFPQKVKLAETLENKTIKDHLDEIKKWYQHKSVFFREDSQIFFARRCLIVEGPAEKYGLPILADRSNKSLDDITIISANGKSKIPYYQLLCNAYGIPYFTLLDLDGLAEDANDNARPVAWAQPGGYQGFSTSFEELFGITGEGGHKISELFVRIDEVAVADIPAEVATAISILEAWSQT